MGLIRFLLAFSVIIFHSAPLFGLAFIDGIVAVKLFFIISGFYMSLILSTKYKGKYKLFLSNRFLRIYPVYWIMLLLTIGFNYYWAFSGIAQVFSPIPHPKNFFLYSSPFGILRDFTLLFRSDYFFPTNPRLPMVAPAWTLIPELLFYMVSPLLVFRKNIVLVVLIIVSFLIRIFAYNSHFLKDEYMLTSFFPATIGYFLIGILAYRIFLKIKDKKIDPKYLLLFTLITSLSIIFWDKLPSIKLFGLLLKEYLLYVLFLFSIPLAFIYTRKNKFDKFFADLSYPIYISHWFFFAFIWFTFSFKSRTQPFVELLVLFTLVWSVLMVFFVERPIDKIRHARVFFQKKRYNKQK